MRVAIDCRKIADFGIGTYVRGLVSGLAELGGGDEYVLIAPRAARGLPEQFERIDLDVPNYTIRELFALARAIGQARADVFHSPHYVIPFTSVPSVATLHDVILFRYPPRNPAARLYVSVMTRRAARKSARIVTVSEAAKRALVETLGCAPEKIAVTPNGVDPAFLAAHPAETSLGRYFLYAGNDKVHKNVDRLVDAFARLHARDSSVRLVLTGAPFERFAARPFVVRPGFVTIERLVALYRGALAVVVPSLDEGFGLPVLEAMAAGVPVAASNIEALTEVAGGAAVHFDPYSVEAIEHALATLARDGELRASLVVRGRGRVEAFSWRRCAESTREVYREALSRRA